jgi:hypothetical protein
MDIFEKYPNSTFLRLLPDDSDLFPLRARIGELFRSLDGLEDGHFEQQLDLDPYARLWEMMLATILTAHGYKPKSSEHGPDFVVERDGGRIFLEAICPGPGDESNPNSVPPIIYGAPEMQEVPTDKIVLRLCHALAEKKARYIQYRDQGIVSETDACVIAISSSRIGRTSGLWPPTIMRATHGLGNPYVDFDKDAGPVAEGIESRSSIQKINRTSVDSKFFASGENGVIAGVLYSDCSVFSLPFDLFGQSLLLHNPKARVPIPVGFVQRVPEIWTICCDDASYWRSYQIGA